MAEEILIDTPSGEKISAIYSKPRETTVEGHEKTLILMVHGFPGHKNSYDDLFGGLQDILVESGFHIVRFDFRGCGASDGRAEDFTLDSASEDIQSMFEWAKQKGYNRFGYVAEGLGAALSLLNLPANLIFMILAWPMLDPNVIIEQAVSPDTPADSPLVNTKLLESVKGKDTTEALKSIDVPVMIMHGAKDKQVPIEQLEFLRKYFQGPRAEITTFEDGDHGLQAMAHRQMMFHHTRQFAGRYYRKTALKVAEKA